MSQQDSAKDCSTFDGRVPDPRGKQALVIFHDVAAYFSEEEWELLQEWQKELYKNVMREIHQALISLGYQIVNPKTLVRINKQEEVPDRDAERGADISDAISSCYPAIFPDILLRIKEEEDPYCKDLYVMKESAASKVTSTGFLSVNADTDLKTEDKSDTYLIEHPGADGGESSDDPRSDHAIISFTVKKEEDVYSDNQVSERMENGNSPTEHDIISLIIKEEDDDYYQNQPHSEKRNTISNPKGSGTISRKVKPRDSVKAPKCKAQATKATLKVFLSSENRANSRRHTLSGSNQELGEEKTTECESDLMNPAHHNLHEGQPRLEQLYTYNEYESTPRNARFPKCQLKTQQNRTQHSCPECKKSFTRMAHLITHQITHSRERPYLCKECGQCFSYKGSLIRHQRTHTGEKLFQCTECEQSFIQKGDLNRHKRTHSGERPYHCTECGKNFSRREILNIHQRTHTGEKPYQCTECEKSFRQKGSLIRHHRTHFGETSFLPK